MVCLVKPQFEAGRDKVGKNGVVREPETHREVIGKIVDYADMIGFAVCGLDHSPIKGPEGNIEFLLYLKKEKEPSEAVMELAEREAETALKQIVQEQTGLSHTPQWEQMIAETVAASRNV